MQFRYDGAKAAEAHHLITFDYFKHTSEVTYHIVGEPTPLLHLISAKKTKRFSKLNHLR